MDDKCIICRNHELLIKNNEMTVCLHCAITHKDKINTSSFIEGLIKEKEKQIHITELFLYFKTVDISQLKGFPKIGINELKKIRKEKEIQNLLEEVKTLKKQKSVRLKYIFEERKDK
ncbi:hypothetical protein PDK93_25410 [Bacillus cereus]|nr:hypothetical protein [Bacillus cereus]